ncbi:MAG: hypothetical protein ABW250_23490, partial [Pyrinomonadaceae bacterium]
MPKTNRFLLIGDHRQPWLKTLQEAARPLGELNVCTKEKCRAQVSKHDYDIVIIDAAAVKPVAELVEMLRNDFFRSRVVVATGSPTWQEARAALLAGAIDYVRKYPDRE